MKRDRTLNAQVIADSFKTTKLDPDLLPTPFEVQTNWHVITGAPCSGKTTLIDQLADKGFHTVPEVLSPKDRLAFILETLSEQGLI